MAILEVEHICKSFNHTEVLKDISFSLEKGQAVSIIGSSGSGKSTLMYIIGCLDTADEGEYLIEGHRGSGLNRFAFAWGRGWGGF